MSSNIANATSPPQPSFNIICWNCNGFLTHLPDIQLLIHKYQPKIFALQETHLQPHHQIHLRNYTIVHQPYTSETRAKGGVLLAVHSSIHTEELQLNTSLQAAAARLFLTPSITVCSIYLPPSKKIDKTELSDLISSLPSPFILLGDFNAHNTIWRGQYTNHHGTVLEDCLTTHNLSIVTPPGPTHFSTAHRTWSTIDLIITSASLIGSLSSYLHYDLAGSDHAPIITILSSANLPPPRRKPPWNFKKTDWSHYYSTLANEQDHISKSLPTENIIDQFSSHLLKTAQSCTPSPKNSYHHKKLVWWTDECKTAIRERRKALKELKKCPSTTNLLTYRKLRAKAQWTLKHAKRKSWQTYVSTITNQTPIKEIWTKIRAIENKTTNWSPTCLKIKDDYITQHLKSPTPSRTSSHPHQVIKTNIRTS